MSPVVQGRYVSGPHPLDELPPSPDPLASLTGWLRPLRWAIRTAGAALVVSICALALLVGVLIVGSLLRAGVPMFMQGDPVMGEQRDIYVAWSEAVPPLIPSALLATVASALVLSTLARVAAWRARRPSEAMIDEFCRRIRPDIATGGPGPEGHGLSGLVMPVSLVGGYIVTWSGLVYFWNLDLLPEGIVAWIQMPFITLAVMGLVIVCAWGVHAFSGYVVGYFVQPLGIAAADIDALERAGEEERLQHALRRWPEAGTPLRLHAAVSVFGSAMPPKPEGSDRRLAVPWAASETGVEILAGTLLATAMIDCRERGLMDYRTDRDRITLTADVPDATRPEGFARVVLGHRRFGLDPGRSVRGSIPDAVRSWMPRGDEDPHWVVIEIALDDLRELGVLVDGRVDVDALQAAARAIKTSENASEQAASEPPVSLLAAGWMRALGKQRIVEAGEGVLGAVGLLTNRRDRGARALPEPLEAD